MAIGWNFPNNNNGEITGIGEAGIETFKGSLFSSLAREICQNSLDARVDSSKPVRIDFILSNVARDKIYGINNLTEAISLCKDYWTENKKTVDFFSHAEKIGKADTIRILRISDFNTTGLTGSDKIKSSPWQDLVKSSGVSNKSGESGGSFGIGKSAPFACSDLRTIFYNTLDKDGLEAYQGVAKLVSFQEKDKQGLFTSKKGEMKQGKGYYGETSYNTAVGTMLELDGYQRTTTGTDVYILGFINHTAWKMKVVQSIIEGYLISILQNDLEVRVDDVLINSTTIHTLIEEYKDYLPLAYNYYLVLTDENTITISENFQGLGILELKILIKKDFKRKVLMARSNGMKIFDKDRISGSIQFAGICILRDGNINEYFRKMENPQHNDWEPDRCSEDEKEKSNAKKTKLALFKFIKDKVLELGKTTVLDEMDAVGAGEFIPDIDSLNGDEANKTEDITNDIKDFTNLERSTIIKTDKGTQIIEDSDLSIDSDDTGDFTVDGTEPATDYQHGDGIRGERDGQNGNGKGDSSGDGNRALKSSITIKPLKLRLFLFNANENLYKLSFTPDQSAQNASVEMSIAGEQSSVNVSISRAEKTNSQLLQHSGNKIFIGDIKANETYSLLFSIKYKEKCSMGVIVHGYKI